MEQYILNNLNRVFGEKENKIQMEIINKLIVNTQDNFYKYYTEGEIK